MSTAMPGYRPTTQGTLGTAVVNVTIPNSIFPGDLMLLTIEQQTAAGTPITPGGWNFIATQAHGTRSGFVYWRFRQEVDTTIQIERPNNAGGRYGLTAYTGVETDSSKWVIGTPRGRATSPADTSYVTTALGITTNRNDTLVVGIFGEATTAGESTSFVPTVSGASVQSYSGQLSSGDIETVLYTNTQMSLPGATGNVTATYPNPQASNAWGMLIGLPSIVTDANAGVKRFPAQMSDGNGKIIDVGLTAMANDGNGVKEVPIAKIELIHSGSLVPDLLRMDRVFTMAHRGGSNDYQEHTLRGYTQSAIAHMDALEVSLARTSDGVFFGAHDDTLNRTTSGLAANYRPREHTWAEISQLSQTLTNRGDPRFTTDRYYTLDEILAVWGNGTHSIFIDPKALSTADRVALIARLKQVPRYQDIFVGKFFHTGTIIADEFAAAGMATWGYAYAEAITGFRSDGQATGDPLLSQTAGKWTMLGLDYGSSEDIWQTALAIANGKKIIAHILPTAATARAAVAKGARGLQVAGINSVSTAY
jgi:hypothetical protein